MHELWCNACPNSPAPPGVAVAGKHVLVWHFA